MSDLRDVRLAWLEETLRQLREPAASSAVPFAIAGAVVRMAEAVPADQRAVEFPRIAATILALIVQDGGGSIAQAGDLLLEGWREVEQARERAAARPSLRAVADAEAA